MQNYLNLMRDIRQNGAVKEDRTGTGTLSVFGRQMRFDLQHGFPLVTTKQVHLKSIIHELLWFLRGETNIRYLKENGVSIWDAWVDPDTAEYRPLTIQERFAALKKNGFEWEVNQLDKVLADLAENAEGPISHNESIALLDIALHLGKEPWVSDGDESFDDYLIRMDIPTAIDREQVEIYLDWLTDADQVRAPKQALVAGELGPVYGSQWRKWEDMRLIDYDQSDAFVENGYLHRATTTDGQWVVERRIDQIDDIIKMLKTNPDSRRIMVSAWNPSYIEEQALPPCHSLFQFYSENLSVKELEQVISARGLSSQFIQGCVEFNSTEHTDAETEQFTYDFAIKHDLPIRKLSCQLYQRKLNCALVA